MRQNRLLVLVGLAILIALFASNFVYRQFKRMSLIKPTPTEQVVVASVALPLGTRLESHHLKLVSWPSGASMRGSFTSKEDCAGRALFTSIQENEPILEINLVPREGGAGLQATIPEGMRAVSVKVNDVVAVAGFVLPGTMVDVLATGSPSGRNGAATMNTRTILENVRVLAAGQKIEQDKEGRPQKVPVITVLVTPEQAIKLTMASTQARIQLSLRNILDSEEAKSPPIYQRNLFGGRGRVVRRPSAPPQDPPSPYVVEVIRGNKRENSTFPGL